MPGPAPKPAERRQRTNSRSGNNVVPFRSGPPVQAPPLPRDLLAITKELWRSFWNSPLAQVVDVSTDRAAITRLFTLYDERERAYRAYRRKRLVVGSQGQSALNPMARAMHAWDAECRQLEDRLGLTPRARLQLGLVQVEAAKSLAELNRLMSEDDDENDDNEHDPRES